MFWAVDLNCQLTDYAAACFFFDILMEGELDKETGDYEILSYNDDEQMPPKEAPSPAKPKKFAMSDAVH